MKTIFYLLLLTSFCLTQAIANDAFATFSSAGLPKSAGANFSMKYPKSWIPTEAKGTSFQRFISNHGAGIDTIHMDADVTPVEISPREFHDAWAEDKMKARIPKGAVFISGKHLDVGGLPAVLVESNFSPYHEGRYEHLRMWQLYFLQRRTLISITFVAAALNEDGSDLEERATILSPLFNEMIQSIKATE